MLGEVYRANTEQKINVTPIHLSFDFFLNDELGILVLQIININILLMGHFHRFNKRRERSKYKFRVVDSPISVWIVRISFMGHYDVFNAHYANRHVFLSKK